MARLSHLMWSLGWFLILYAPVSQSKSMTNLSRMFLLYYMTGLTYKIIYTLRVKSEGSKSSNVLNVTRTQCSTHVKRVSQHSAESRGFSPGTPVSSHREVDRVG